VTAIRLYRDINVLTMATLGWANTWLLNHMEFGTRYDGSQLIIRHVDGALELRGVLSAEGWWLAIGPVQDGLRGTDTGCMRCTLIL
jgi:hypothetical protein